MLPDQEERIRLRAYEIWEREGRPEGREVEHWERARSEIGAERSTRTQGVPAARVLGTAPPAAEIAARGDPSGRGRLSEAQERAEQVTFASEADPLGRVQGESNLPDETAMDPRQVPAQKQRSVGRSRNPRAKKPSGNSQSLGKTD